MNIIAWLILGAIAGYLAGFLVKGDEGYGVIGHVVLGIVGALVGGFLASLLFNVDDPIQARSTSARSWSRSSAPSSRSSCSTWSPVEPGPAAAQSRQPAQRRPGSLPRGAGPPSRFRAVARSLMDEMSRGGYRGRDDRPAVRRGAGADRVGCGRDRGDAERRRLAAHQCRVDRSGGRRTRIRHPPDQRKLRNLRRDPRIAVTLQGERINQWGLREYLVIDGTARVTDGGRPNSSSAWRGPIWAPMWSSRRCRTRRPASSRGSPWSAFQGSVPAAKR